MFIEIFLLLLFGHILGDFYLQTASVAKKKENSMSWVFIHCAGYYGMMLVVCLPIISWKIALGASIAAISHLFIDIIKYLYLLKKKKNAKSEDRCISLDEEKRKANDSKIIHTEDRRVKLQKGKNKRRNSQKRYHNKESNSDNHARVRAAEVNHSSVKSINVHETVINNKMSYYDEIDLKQSQIIDRNSFFVDQGFHIVCLLAITYLLIQSNAVLKEWPLVKEFFDTSGLSELQVMKWLLALLLIHKPANIAIAKLLLIYKPKDKEETKLENYKAENSKSEDSKAEDSKSEDIKSDRIENAKIAKQMNGKSGANSYNKTDTKVDEKVNVNQNNIWITKDDNDNSSMNAGRFIGTVERIIMLIFLSTGQYSAIGLVLTAKSIARYDRITKDPAFAEYYLLGTLLSTLFVILASFVI